MFVDDRVLRAQAGEAKPDPKITPSGLQMRLDRATARAVVSTLEEHAVLPPGRVWVAVRNGWVTLKGEVDWESQRTTAAVLASHRVGVRGVTNAISVRHRLLARNLAPATIGSRNRNRP